MIKDFKIFKKVNLNKKNVDYNKIYTFHYNNQIINIGKISDNPGNGFRDKGCIFVGYSPKGEVTYNLVNRGYWKFIREATPEEINIYELFNMSNKYNL